MKGVSDNRPIIFYLLLHYQCLLVSYYKWSPILVLKSTSFRETYSFSRRVYGCVWSHYVCIVLQLRLLLNKFCTIDGRTI